MKKQTNLKKLSLIEKEIRKLIKENEELKRKLKDK